MVTSRKPSRAIKNINKIRLFLDKILAKFQDRYTPTRELAALQVPAYSIIYNTTYHTAM